MRDNMLCYNLHDIILQLLVILEEKKKYKHLFFKKNTYNNNFTILCSASWAFSELKYCTRAVPLNVVACSSNILHNIIGPKGRNISYKDLLST